MLTAERRAIQEAMQQGKATARRKALLNAPTSATGGKGHSRAKVSNRMDWKEFLSGMEVGQVERVRRSPTTPAWYWGKKLDRKFKCRKDGLYWIVERLR